MSIKGYADQKKEGADGCQFVTVQPCRAEQNALDVAAQVYGRLIANDAAEANSTATSIVATAHSARRGDIIQFTSGNLSGLEVRVASKSANAIGLAEELSEAPAAADTFAILRPVTPRANSSGELAVNATVSPAGGRDFAESVYWDYDSGADGNVNTSDWEELIASTSADINALHIFDSSGQTLELGVGAAASESRVLLIPPGGYIGPVNLLIASGSRVSIRAVSATATVGALVLTGLD